MVSTTIHLEWVINNIIVEYSTRWFYRFLDANKHCLEMRPSILMTYLSLCYMLSQAIGVSDLFMNIFHLYPKKSALMMHLWCTILWFLFKGHKNCKLFITHGGYHSLVEALHYGLPLIGFPFYTDQFYNMRFVIENGFGIEILLENLNVNVLVDAIGKIFSDKR